MLMACSLFTKAQQGAEILIQANRATLERNFDEAIRLYGQFVKLNPNDFRGYFNRGTTEYNAAKYDDFHDRRRKEGNDHGVHHRAKRPEKAHRVPSEHVRAPSRQQDIS